MRDCKLVREEGIEDWADREPQIQRRLKNCILKLIFIGK